ncbi:ATP-grasp fold amidoligase family protein [Natronolimnohabitans sp. A-GB9]|uniref:ATP-grasp fold amidoligase family protein n=1 Tax=Natronolimnohabitans sp. A-GB9 TaxID=3069757 RepID=UPI0027AFD741|nr:ATP-grasp fold amidoligase family protein [Natronolimnohabitans sp. A-GB9]MDQ2052696.1 ATP-grasp fold amidoligase family protein [Natronolimnohabitans sp. A-GB9]
MSKVKTKSKIELLAQSYRDSGIKGVVINVWLYLLEHSVVAPFVEKLLGKTYHQKLISFPTLGYWPNIRSPRSLNEKIMHRMLFTDKDLYSKVADKWRVREYVNKKVGDQILNDVYYVTDDPETIPFDDLPQKFVIKPTHSCGNVIIVEDKDSINFGDIKESCKIWMNTKYGDNTNEYWYQDIKPQIIIEEYIDSGERKAPLDYKFFVFHGNVQFIQVDFGRFSQHKMTLYSKDWEVLDFKKGYPRGPDLEQPSDLEQMIKIAETLGEDFDFARVDMYNPEEGEIRFGEITLAPGAGHSGFDPVQADFEIGKYW